MHTDISIPMFVTFSSDLTDCKRSLSKANRLTMPKDVTEISLVGMRPRRFNLFYLFFNLNYKFDSKL